MIASRKKRGRKARYAVYNGREVEGLYITFNSDKSVRNFYYLDDNKKQISCTSDIVEAVRRYREYQNQNSTVELLSVPSPVSIDTLESFDKSIDTEKTVSLTIHKDGTISKRDINTYSKQEIVDTFVQLLREDQYEIAEMAGIPQFAHLEDIVPRPKSLTLEQIGDTFFNREDISKSYKKDTKIYWKEFTNIVGKSDIRKINYQDIGTYNDTVHRQSKGSTVNNIKRFINNKFNSIKAVLFYAKKRFEYKKDIDNLLSYMEQLHYVTKYKGSKPKVLSNKEFQTMLSKADNPLTKCLLLLGLNCGMRYSDIINLKKAEIDFEESTLQRPRTKTGIIHSAILWKDTIKALKEYMKDNDNESEYVFTTKYNNQYMEKYLRTIYFDSVKVDSITHKHLRNSLSSIANRLGCNPNGIKICMGHNISSVDNSYNERHPEATKEVCQVVYDFYFGKTK